MHCSHPAPLPPVQVVAGLRQHISREELGGRLVAVVLNLKPAKLAGELSEAMILAADHTPVRGRGAGAATLSHGRAAGRGSAGSRSC